MAKTQTEILTIMFIDIANYTETTSRLSRSSFNDLHDVFDKLVVDTISQYNGKVVKKIGDAFLITFKSATDAVHCGIKMQKEFYRYNDENDPPIPLNIRVALHTGEVILRKNDIYGEAVNATSRIESVVKTGDVVFSEAVYFAMNKSEVPYKYLGNFKLKGLKVPIRLFKVKSRQDYAKEARIRNLKIKRRFRKRLRASLIFIVLFILLLVMVFMITENLDSFLRFLS